MTYNIADIKKEVRIALDQNMNSVPLINVEDIDTLSMEEILESKILDAAYIVTQEAPYYLLDGGKSFSGDIEWMSHVGYGGGTITLPDDFLRLVSFQMSDWSYPVTAAITPESPLYAAQFSRFAGIKGSPQRPVIAISLKPEAKKLEFFSCRAGSKTHIKQASYIPMPKIEDASIDICERLKPATVYRIAYLVALSISNAELATIMLNVSKELLQ